MDDLDGDGRKTWRWRCAALVKLAGVCALGLLPRRGAWLATACILVAGGVLAVSLGDRFLGGPSPFSPDRWRAGGLVQRGRMAADLCAGGALRGRTRAEVLEVLGEPDRDFKDVIEYDILPPRRGTARPEWVAVRFDRAGERVIEVQIQD